MSTPGLITAEELLHLNLPNKRTELVRGRLVVREPGGYTHGRVAANILGKLSAHLEHTRTGQLFAAETGFTLARGPDTVRAPDLAYVRRERLLDPEPRGFPDLAPDLVVEVLSPDDRPGEVLAKVADWLSAGTPLVWIIDPQRRSVRVYRADGTADLLTADRALDGEGVLPGFSCPLEQIL
jgi:Uma2 family endonuclease